MNTKEISTVASRVFLSCLLPSWIARSQEDQDDYGVDFELEPLDENGRASGVLFKAQVKGVEKAAFDSEGRLVFKRADVTRFRYYTESLHVALIFVVCDASAEVCYWVVVQGNRELEVALAVAAEQKQGTFTLKLSPHNILERTPDCADRVLQAIRSAENAITLRRLKEVPISSVHAHVAQVKDLAAEVNRFRLWASLVDSRVIENLISNGDLQAAYARARALFESSREPVEARLLGGFYTANLYSRLQVVSGKPSAHIDSARHKANIAFAMLAISRDKSCPATTRRFVRIYSRAARVLLRGRQAMSLAISERGLAAQGETLIGPLARLQLLQASGMVVKDFFKLVDGMNRLGADGFFAVMPHALMEIAEGVLPFVMMLKFCGENDVAKAYTDAAYRFLPFCVGIAKQLFDRNEAIEVITGLGVRLLFLPEPSEVASYFEAVRKSVDGEPYFDGQQEVLDRLDVVMREAVEVRDQEPRDDEIDDFYRQQAAGLGIDLEDPDDEIAQVVRIGIEDRDPTRVAKHCEHIHVLIESYGVPAEMLGLPTAGRKRVLCVKHGHSVSAMRLDDAFERFRQLHADGSQEVSCDNCTDKVPHPDNWRWTAEWSQHQDERLRAKRGDVE